MNLLSGRIYVLFLFSIALFSCNSRSTEIQQGRVVQSKTVHIVVKNSTDSLLRIKLRVGLNDTIQNQHLVSKKLDTLVIGLGRERLITIESKAALAQSLVVNPGDSLFIALIKGKLSVKSTAENALIDPNEAPLNSDLSRLQDSLYAKLVKIDSLRSLAVSDDYSSRVLYPISFQKSFNQDHPEVLREFTKAAYAEVSGLMNKLSTEVQFESTNALPVKEEVQLNRIFRRISFLARQQKDEAYTANFLNSSFFDDDFIMQSAYGNSYLSQFITEGILKGERRRTSNKIYIEFAKAYDSLGAFFKEPMLARARAYCLERMVSENESYETISTYATAYQNAYPDDSLFLSSFSENFLISQKALVQSEIGLNLLLENGSTKMLTGLLNELKGKVVYIDYWASWCAPCRDAMPSSLRLRNNLKDKDIAFVYFSIDNGQEAWKKASSADGLEDYIHNYLVLNHVKSQMRNNLSIGAIPRYLIFDKEGKLVEKNAPGPRDENLEVILNKYIAN